MISHSKSICTNNRGITLSELLVATFMIGIVMIGVASFSLAIRNLHRATDKSVIIALRAKSAMSKSNSLEAEKQQVIQINNNLDTVYVDYTPDQFLINLAPDPNQSILFPAPHNLPKTPVSCPEPSPKIVCISMPSFIIIKLPASAITVS